MTEKMPEENNKPSKIFESDSWFDSEELEKKAQEEFEAEFEKILLDILQDNTEHWEEMDWAEYRTQQMEAKLSPSITIIPPPYSLPSPVSIGKKSWSELPPLPKPEEKKKKKKKRSPQVKVEVEVKISTQGRERTKMCKYGEKCRRQTCTFAHTLDELCPPLCRNGERCRFARKELRCHFFHPERESKTEFLTRMDAEKSVQYDTVVF